MPNYFKQEIPSNHYDMLKRTVVKDVFPDMRIGKKAIEELSNKVYLLMVKARDRAKMNKRTTIMYYDL